MSPFKDPSTGWHGPHTWIRNACLWNLRVSYSSLFALFWDKSTQWDRRPYALAAKMSAPRQGELTLGCSVLSLGCSTILSSRKLFVLAQKQRQYPTKSVARSCWKFRRKPFFDRTYINYAQSGVFKSAATAVFSITILNMSKKIKEYSGMIQISWQSMEILDITKKRLK